MRLRREQIDPAGDAEIAEVIAGQQIDRLEIGRAVEIAEGLDVGIPGHRLAQDDDVAEVGFQPEAGKPRAPTEIAADMGRGIGAIVVIKRAQPAEPVLAQRAADIPARAAVDLLERLLAQG